ncbi:2-dehydro-3-deoxygalactonokinase [Siminovitchia fortis]|uniref:2-dehydro-3-deoxygalactonokinase n=1 Tax=Siminovitchia fortis TaxID=254758 RepID=A0A443IVI9_9BACI|nr:2-dehydro-3-deoxygalactonokinase [Siminovitchia fortis]RWR12149.1 2-dehydro-3-deoxygalactonokinase [Siminovitchia fortis]WHY81016.1 2-dehydro-3-deoxygalactonokinase [Siminovitchia fortis]
MFAILIDTGTTNSRIRLVDNRNNLIRDSENFRIGVRNTAIDGHNKKLKEAIHERIGQILNRNGLDANEISYIVASGMITSNLGLYEVPHVKGPITIEELADFSKVICLEELYNIPCVFVPGMSNSVSYNEKNLDFINHFDVMRGEEVESVGLIKQLNLKGKGILVLPGSHTKFVIIDENQTISTCLSTLAGETLMAIQRETILSDSLNSSLIESIDEEILLKGFEAARTYGLTRSFYHIRLLQLFSNLDENACANYFVGAVLAADIQSLLATIPDVNKVNWIAVGGNNPLRQAFVFLLGFSGPEWSVIEATDQQVEYSMVYGAQEIAGKVDHKFLSI